MTYKNGDVYIGDYKNDKRNGKGVSRFNNGSFYKGDYTDDNMHGYGMYHFTYTGDVYTGEFENNNMHGKGTMTYKNGDVYEGEWKDGNQNGKGKMTYINGNVYDGEWKNGKQHGYGKMTYSNGDVYEGVWKDDKPYPIEFTISNTKYDECLEKTAFDPIEGDVNVGDFMNEDNGNLVFKLGNSFFGINKEQMRPIYKNSDETVYCCKKIGTIRRENIDIDNPFFNMNKIGIISGIVNHDYITKILGDTKNQLYEVVRTEQECIATATGQMLGRLTGEMMVGADHCQEKSDKVIYEIQIIKKETRTRKTFKKRSRKNNSKKSKSKSKSKKSKKRIFISSSL